jgi:hypothetical protein
MQKIKELYIFDLDETLLRVPSYTTKHLIEDKNPGVHFDDVYSFYDNPLSLCDKLNNIQLIEPVFREWEEANADLDCAHVLITHRVDKLKETVIDLLSRKGVTFDETYFLGRVSDKSDVVEYLLTFVYEPTSINKIKIFEDSIDQIFKYQQYFNSLVYNIDIEYWIVDKARVFKIGDIQLSDKKRITLI